MRDEIVHHAQRPVQQVELRLDVAGGGLALGAGFARLGDEQIVGGDGRLQQVQLGGGLAVIRERRQVRGRRVVNSLATLGGLHVAPGHQTAQRKNHLVRQRLVLGFGGVGVDGAGDDEGGLAHGQPRLLFVGGDALGVLRLRQPERLDVGDMRLRVRVTGGKGRDGGDDDGVGVANAFNGQCGGEFVQLSCGHGHNSITNPISHAKHFLAFINHPILGNPVEKPG